MITDSKRLQQVLKNLLSNAFKFTEQGGIRLAVAPAVTGWSAEHPMLQHAGSVVAFEVADTGIGIPQEKQRIIFEAFQQADAGTSRKYGGTGLGLAISRELATLLGGEIQLRSVPGLGSTFTLYLPQTFVAPATRTSRESRDGGGRPVAFPAVRVWTGRPETVADDRNDLMPGDAVLLIVEDDPHYAQVLVDQAHARDFKVLVAARGVEALALAREHLPTAVSLDVFLPDMLGWTVLSQLKQDPALRHIPVQIITLDEDRQHGLTRGAFGFLPKPTTAEGLDAALSRMKAYTTPRLRRLLVVEDNEAEQLSIAQLLGHDDVEIEAVGTGAGSARRPPRTALRLRGARSAVARHVWVRRPGAHQGRIPGSPMSRWWFSPARSFLPRRTPGSTPSLAAWWSKASSLPNGLLDETSLFLHRVLADLPPDKQQMLDRLHRSDDDLVGKKVLVVDDDIRNIFALSSVLERRGMEVLTAGTGDEAIATLEGTSGVAIVLMDIMMPQMDGYQTMQAIRQMPAHRRLPIIALTAKAMKGDREKCLDAGASDYPAKPVNTEQLLSALRMWLHR